MRGYATKRIQIIIDTKILNKIDVVIGKKNLKFLVPKYISPGNLNNPILDMYGNNTPIIINNTPSMIIIFCIVIINYLSVTLSISLRASTACKTLSACPLAFTLYHVL